MAGSEAVAGAGARGVFVTCALEFSSRGRCKLIKDLEAGT